ncbi:DEAD/DEAH box helicase [Vibrio sp. S11_S32]|uniref:DEAD/DEAH box helicase n=1 Tax=Vibrio sp. S11_S32 TaxID=2720225 RepID=UPI001680AD27|nr:DEAD/DEAH box helicase [Vibrio sp. S11_S32]MBD1577138.1 DEAD/DEAH box helicase [Vibrio sp. S11_S32]
MNFSELQLNSDIINALPSTIANPTPVQQQAIPAILHDADVLALAHTGSGKTLAFGLPVLQMIDNKNAHLQAVIIAPTRELARQTAQTLKPIAKALSIQTATLFGGVDLVTQAQQLAKLPHVIIVTPGRLLALAKEGKIDLSNVKHLVLDEADRLLDMGFWSDIQALLTFIPIQRQTLCFSATLTETLAIEVQKVLTSPVEIKTNNNNSVVDGINEQLFLVNKGSKTKVLISLLKQQPTKQVLIFINAKDNADTLVKKLIKADINVKALHGNKEQIEREATLHQFKQHTIQVLVATDLLARGIDIDALPVVINFDLPDNAPVYVHRIGRTARAGKLGSAISLVCHAETEALDAIRALTKNRMPLQTLSDFPVTDKPSTGVAKRPAKDKQANRRSAKKRSIKDFQPKADRSPEKRVPEKNAARKPRSK